MRILPKALSVAAILTASTSVHAIGISFYSTSGGVLEDAALFATLAGAPPRYSIPLGDFDLGAVNSEAVVDVPVGDGTSTHWWLIGHQGPNIVYSSLQNLAGVDAMAVEPFSLGDIFTIPTVIAQLDHFNSGGSFTPDITGLLHANHTSHITPDKDPSNLWLFSSPGSSIGLVAVSMHDNTPPGFGPVPPIPEPATVLLLGSGLVAFASARKGAKR